VAVFPLNIEISPKNSLLGSRFAGVPFLSQNRTRQPKKHTNKEPDLPALTSKNTSIGVILAYQMQTETTSYYSILQVNTFLVNKKPPHRQQ
jgi:hypothetical protein